MTQEEILQILHNGANKPKNDLTDFTKGKREGLIEAYSHAWTLVKNLTLADVRQSVCTFWDLCDSKRGDLCIDNDEDCKYHKWADDA